MWTKSTKACMHRQSAGGMSTYEMCFLFYGGGKGAAAEDSRARFDHLSNGLTTLFYVCGFLKSIVLSVSKWGKGIYLLRLEGKECDLDKVSEPSGEVIPGFHLHLWRKKHAVVC